MNVRLTRRQFIAITAGAAAGTAIPGAVAKWVGQAAVATDTDVFYFLSTTQAATCAAACARLVPSSDPLKDPGANEAHAVVFIDRFLAAFDLAAAGVSDGPPIWLTGPSSTRNPYPDNTTGLPSSEYPKEDSFYSGGKFNTIAPTRVQTIVWRAQLYGESELAAGDSKWASQVKAGTIPGVAPGGLRKLYADGLEALDGYSKSVTGQPFAQASPEEQDFMLAAVGNVVLAAILPNFPLSQLPVGVAPPPAAQALYPTLVSHTFQACYGLPEYRQLDSNPLWELIGYDGDTIPLGNSIYGSELDGDNDGFGDGVYEIVGGYHEYRPVSYLPDGDTSALTPAQTQQVVKFLGRLKP